MKFPNVIAEMRKGGRIKAAVLHYFDFKSGAMFAWSGLGDLTTYDGLVWKGVGDVAKMEGGGYFSGLSANNLKLTIALEKNETVDRIINATINSEAEVYGRRYFRAIQFFDESDQIVDQYRPTFIGVMDRMSFRATATAREITLNVESPFVRKKTPRVINFTDTDQRRYDPNDRFLEFISTLATKTIKWPNY